MHQFIRGTASMAGDGGYQASAFSCVQKYVYTF